MDITIQASYDLKIVEKFEKMQDYLRKRMYTKGWSLALRFQKEIRHRLSTGYYGIKKQTGALRDSVSPVRRFISEDTLSIGIEFRGNKNTPHLNTHVGSGFQFISPAKSKYLWIPLSFGPAYRKNIRHKLPRDFGLEDQGGILSIVRVHGKLFAVQRAKKDHKILKWYYVLKDNVVVLRRVDPDEIGDEFIPIIEVAYFDVFEQAVKKYMDEM